MNRYLYSKNEPKMKPGSFWISKSMSHPMIPPGIYGFKLVGINGDDCTIEYHGLSITNDKAIQLVDKMSILNSYDIINRYE